MIVWAGRVQQGAGPGGRWPRFRGGWPDGRVTAGAVFERETPDSEWRCVLAVPVLSWFVDTPQANIQTWLRGEARKRGWRYEWARRYELTE